MGVQEQDLSIRELDDRGQGNAVEGVIRFRCDHKTGGGFHVRIGDSSGEIDVRFWQAAAAAFKADPMLRTGLSVRFEGFYMVRLHPKDAQYAPPGRRHSLNFSMADSVRYH